MEVRINRKKYKCYAFDIESHNDEESIRKRETSMWLGCLIDENSKIDDESSYLYDMDSFIDKIEELEPLRRPEVVENEAAEAVVAEGEENTIPTLFD